MNYTDKLHSIGTKGNMGDWQGRHLRAIDFPHGQERPVVHMLRGWLEYADAHAQRYESGIGEDGVLGPAWAEIGDALRQLLNGELGRLDAGTLDSVLYETLKGEGFDPDNL